MTAFEPPVLAAYRARLTERYTRRRNVTQSLLEAEHTVYAHFDRAGRALYVGFTNDYRTRQHNHRNGYALDDWTRRVARTETETVSGRINAEVREFERILELLPEHNILGNPLWKHNGPRRPSRKCFPTIQAVPVQQPRRTA